MSLPQKLKYDNAINASYAKNFVSKINCQNTNNHNLGNTAIINIPCMSNQVLSGADSLLKMKLKLENGTAGNADVVFDRAGVAGCIQRIRVFSGSQLLQDLDNYGNLVTQLISYQVSPDALLGKLSVLQGTASASTGEGNTVGANSSLELDLCFPLMTILSLTEKYVPCYAMANSGPLRLEIQFVSDFKKFLNTDVELTDSVGGVFKNVQFLANFIEISDTGMSIIKQAQKNRPVEWVTQSFSNYVYNGSINAGGSEFTVPVPAKFNSLKALYATFRKNADGVLNRFPFDSANWSLEEYRTAIGSRVIPSEPPTSVPEFLAETERALGCVSNRLSNTSYTSVQIVADVASTDNVISNCFMVGIETESYSSAPMGSTYQGLNTTGSDIYFRPKFGAQTAVDIRIDIYASFDQLITIDDTGVPQVQF